LGSASTFPGTRRRDRQVHEAALTERIERAARTIAAANEAPAS